MRFDTLFQSKSRRSLHTEYQATKTRLVFGTKCGRTSPQQGIFSLAGRSTLQVPQHSQLLVLEFARSRRCSVGICITSEGLCSLRVGKNCARDPLGVPLSCSLAAVPMSERSSLSLSVRSTKDASTRDKDIFLVPIQVNSSLIESRCRCANAAASRFEAPSFPRRRELIPADPTCSGSILSLMAADIVCTSNCCFDVGSLVRAAS